MNLCKPLWRSVAGYSIEVSITHVNPFLKHGSIREVREDGSVMWFYWNFDPSVKQKLKLMRVLNDDRMSYDSHHFDKAEEVTESDLPPAVIAELRNLIDYGQVVNATWYVEEPWMIDCTFRLADGQFGGEVRESGDGSRERVASAKAAGEKVYQFQRSLKWYYHPEEGLVIKPFEKFNESERLTIEALIQRYLTAYPNFPKWREHDKCPTTGAPGLIPVVSVDWS